MVAPADLKQIRDSELERFGEWEADSGKLLWGSKTASNGVAFLVVWHEGCLMLAHYNRCSDLPPGMPITRGPPTTNVQVRLYAPGGNPQWRTRQIYR